MSSYKIIDTGNNIPVVCIAMLAYNHGEYISEAIKSILMQKLQYSYKIIIAEDCSTDNTRDILLRYQEKYPDKIKLILQNRNVGAFNNNFDLLSNLEGKYIAALEGDDYWTDPFKLQKQVGFLEEHANYSAIFSNVNVLLESGTYNNANEMQPILESREFTGSEILENWISHTATYVFRNGCGIDKFLMLNQKHQFMYGDTPLLLCLLEYGKLFGLKEYTATYRRHKGGITNQVQNNSFYLRFIMHLKAIQRAFDNEVYTTICNRSITIFYMKLFFNSAFYEPIKYLYFLRAIQHDKALIFNIVKDKVEQRKIIKGVQIN